MNFNPVLQSERIVHIVLAFHFVGFFLLLTLFNDIDIYTEKQIYIFKDQALNLFYF